MVGEHKGLQNKIKLKEKPKTKINPRIELVGIKITVPEDQIMPLLLTQLPRVLVNFQNDHADDCIG